MSSFRQRLMGRGMLLPGGFPQINWDNPITGGMIGCWPALGEGGSASPFMRDLITNTTIPKSGTSANIKNFIGGLGAVNNGNQTHYVASSMAASHQVQQWTLLTMFTCVGTQNFQSTILAGGSSVGATWGLSRGTTGSARDIRLSLNNGVGGLTNTITNALPSASAGTYGVVGILLPTGGTYTYGLAVNGFLSAYVTGNSFGGSGAISYAAPLNETIGVSGGNGNFALHLGALWGRALSPGEMSVLSADPTQILTFPENMFLFTPSADAFIGALSDSMATGESLAGQLLAQGASSDSLATSETLAAIMQAIGAFAETLTSAGQLNTVLVALGALSDALTQADALNGQMISTGALLEALTQSDSLAATMQATGLFADGVATTEAIAAALIAQGALLDGLTQSDVFNGGYGISGSFSGGLGTSDSTDSGMQANSSFADSLATGDQIIATTVLLGELIDALTDVDFYSAQEALQFARRWVYMHQSRRSLALAPSLRSVRLKPSVRNAKLPLD